MVDPSLSSNVAALFIILYVPFFDNPSDPDGWSMNSASQPFLDRRTLFTIAPGDLQTGESFTMDIAYSFHREAGSSHLENVNVLLEEVAEIKADFEGQFDGLFAHVHITTKSKEFLEIFNALIKWRQREFPESINQ